MSKNLRGKAEDAMMKTQSHLTDAIREQKIALLREQFLGNKVEMLVRKFAMKLLQKMRDRKDIEMQKSNEQFVSKMLN